MKKINLLAILSVFLMTSCNTIATFPSNSDSSSNTTSGTQITTTTSTSNSTSTTLTTSTSSSTSGGEYEKVVPLKFAGFNDFHGAIEETGNSVGLSKLVTYIKQKKSEGAIICNSGDMWQETFLSSECKGTIISKAFKEAGVDVNTLGNHDFDWSVDAIRLNESVEGFNEEMLGANIVNYPKTTSTWTKSDLGKEYKTFVYNQGLPNEIKVGVVGVIGKDQITSITSKMVENYVFYDHNETIKNVSTKLRSEEGCDVVIASCHTPCGQLDSSLFDYDANGQRKYIDGAFCAHDHSLESLSINDAPIMEASCRGQYMSEFTLYYNVETNKVESSTQNNVFLADLNLKEDEQTKALVDSFASTCNELGNTVYGQISGYMDRTTIGRWQAQCAAEKATELGINIDFAVVNSARSSLKAGSINHYDMHETHPFINELYVVQVTGGDLYNEIYKYSNPFYRLTTKSLSENSTEKFNILIYNYLLFHVKVNDTTYEKTYDYFPSLTNSEYEPYILKDASGDKINVLDLTIKDLQNKGTIDPISYSENSWHNTKSMLTEQQS